MAAGAGYEGQGGLGAVISGQFLLKEGTALNIAVGQRGRSRSTANIEMAIGGAGGTFVVIDPEDDQDDNISIEPFILLVAGWYSVELHQETPQLFNYFFFDFLVLTFCFFVDYKVLHFVCNEMTKQKCCKSFKLLKFKLLNCA